MLGTMANHPWLGRVCFQCCPAAERARSQTANGPMALPMAAVAQDARLAELTPTLAELTPELAQNILSKCHSFRDASNLLCTSRHWAALAADDSTWSYLAPLIACEAHLHYATPTPTTSWKSECDHLFANRGTFVSIFGNAPTPAPPVASFTIDVGCRFRPAGGMSAPEEVSSRENVLPLHQRLRCIMEAHGCSASEARRRLWATSGGGTKSDPWVEAAAVMATEKENCTSNGEEAPCDAADGPATDARAPATAPESASAIDVSEAASSAEAAADEAEAEAEGPSAAPTESLSSACGLISLGGGSAIVCAPGTGVRAFDMRYTWSETSEQHDVYAQSVAPLVSGVLNGRSACVLAYGQTGAGKSHTMYGTLGDAGSDAGVVPRAVRAIIRAVDERTSSAPATADGKAMEIKASIACIEVYGDAVSDLLANGADERVGGFWQGVSAAATAAGYADVPLTSVSEAVDLLERADGAKRRAATLMNERSSRAHSLVMISLEQRVDGEGPVRSQLCLADLGGCEKVKKSGVRGERLLEAIHINQGLLALKSVITALNQQKAYVPYQDDKLTMLLRRSLSGGAQTCVLLACRPEAEHATETLQALRFGEAAMQVEVTANGGGNARAAAAALEALDKQVAALEHAIRDKERFETFVERRVDERAGLLDAAGFGAGLTDMKVEEKKVSRIVGAERERATLEKVLAARRALLGE